jgi:hypothetical protein
MTDYELVDRILKLIAKEPWARQLLVQAGRGVASWLR